MIRFNGTKSEIIQQWEGEYAQLKKEDGEQEFTYEQFSVLFDLLDQYSDDDELFIVTNNKDEKSKKLIAPEAKYYISIKSGTWLLCSLLMNLFDGSALTQAMISFIEKYLGDKLNDPIVKKLHSALGESCIMLEAAQNKKTGIQKDV